MTDTNLSTEPPEAPLPIAESQAQLTGEGPADLGALAGAPSPRNSLDSLLERATAPVDPGVQQQFVDLKQRQMGAYERQQANEERIHGEDRAGIKRAMALQQATIDHTPKWDADAERAKYKTDPIQEFGSFASVFAMVASAFTRAPMINALNGAAAAINAKRENNEKEYDRSLEAFKVNSDLAIKRFNMQHTALNDAFTLMDKDQNRGRAKLQETLTKFGMEKELMLYQNGMIPEIREADAGQLKAATEISRIRLQFDQFEDQKKRTDIMAKRAGTMSTEEAQAVAQLTAKYEAEGLDPAAAHLKAITEVSAAKKPAGSGKPTEAGEREAEARRRYDAEVAKLDPEDPEFEAKRQKIWSDTHKGVRPGAKSEDLGSYKGTEAQNKNMLFATMLDRGVGAIDQLDREKGYKPSPKDLIAFELMEGARRTNSRVNLTGLAANYALSPEAQKFYQGAREFTAGVLRRETGAAFGQNELTNVITRYIPSPGDSPELATQKKTAREEQRKAMWLGTGLPPAAWSLDAAQAVLSGGKPPAKPESIAVGPATRDDKEGQTYTRNGWLWEKRGDLIVPVKPTGAK